MRIMRRVASILAFVIAGAVAAPAQTPSSITRSQMQIQINDLIIDNTTGQITPSNMRSILLNITQSTAALLDANTFTAMPAFPCNGLMQANSAAPATCVTTLPSGLTIPDPIITFIAGSIPNQALANDGMTINGTLCLLGAVCVPPSPSGPLTTTPVKVFNIDQDYHAVGNGIADDYPAFAAAFTACGAASGGRVIIGPNRYYIGTSLTVPANCSLVGNNDIMPYSSEVPTMATSQPYALLLGVGVTINMGSGSAPDHSSGISGVAIFNNAVAQIFYNGGVPPTIPVQNALTAIAAYAGVGITIPHTSQGSLIDHVIIGGFTLCMDSETDDLHVARIIGDCTNGVLVNNASNLVWFHEVEFISLLTIGVANSDERYTVTDVGNDGSGAAQITVNNSGTHSAPTSNLANGDSVWLSGLAGRSDLTGKWAIANLAIGGSTTTFSIVGSSFVAATVTGNVVGGSPYVTGLSSTASPLGYFGGQGAADTAGGSSCIPASTTITWINPDTSEMFLNKAATCSANGDTITVTPAAYTSGGTVDFNTIYRSGYGFKVTNGQEVQFQNTFDNSHQIEYDISTGSSWAQFNQFSCDFLPLAQDPTRICINIESTASQPIFTTGTILDAGIEIKENTSGPLSGPSFRAIFNDISVQNNHYLGYEILNGGAQFGGGVNFRSSYPNFVGDGALIQDLGTHNNVAPQTIYQSAADVSLATFLPIGSPVTAGQGHLPMVLPSSGTIGNNGALSGITAVAAIYPNAYCSLPAGAIFSGSAAGLYYCVFSSTTAATIYNNPYIACGTPTIPTATALAPFVTTGPGAYTQTTGTPLQLYCYTVPANYIGPNGSMFVSAQYTTNATATVKVAAMKYDNFAFASQNSTSTSVTQNVVAGFANNENSGIQSQLTNTVGTGGTSTVAPVFGAVDSTIAKNIGVFGELATAATDTITLNNVVVTFTPAVP